MLISKLVEGLETPNIIEHKVLPLPVKDYDDSPVQLRTVFAAKDASVDTAEEAIMAETTGSPVQAFARLPTVPDSDSENGQFC